MQYEATDPGGGVGFVEATAASHDVSAPAGRSKIAVTRLTVATAIEQRGQRTWVWGVLVENNGHLAQRIVVADADMGQSQSVANFVGDRGIVLRLVPVAAVILTPLFAGIHVEIVVTVGVRTKDPAVEVRVLQTISAFRVLQVQVHDIDRAVRTGGAADDGHI